MEQAPIPSSPSSAGRRPGGRSARVRAAVLRATFQLLIERGAEGFTIPDVAADAGVHETSIYRRWGSKADLIVDTCLHFAGDAIEIPDTGALRSDLIVLFERVSAFLTSPPGQAFLAMTASKLPPAVNARRDYFRRRFALARVVFDRAAARGEFSSRIDAYVLLEGLVAPLYFRLLVTHEPLETWPVQEMVDSFLRGHAS